MKLQILHTTIVSLFSRIDGHWFVDSSNYTISKQDKSMEDLIDRGWIIVPGEKLQMDINLRSLENVEGILGKIICPFCECCVGKARKHYRTW